MIKKAQSETSSALCGGDTRSAAVVQSQSGRLVAVHSAHLCAITDIGPRPANEDRFYLSDHGHFWIVADGMGGEAAGEIASQIAVETIANSLLTQQMGTRTRGGISYQLERAFALAQRGVLAYAASNPDCKGMGSAVLAAVIDNGDLHLCHAGDVRCYLCVRHALTLITEDHSPVARLVRLGVLSLAQARTAVIRHQLDQAIGISTGLSPSLYRRRLRAGTLVLICTDGLWESLDDSCIESILKTPNVSLIERATALADRALASGGRDNITLVLYDHR